MNRPESDIAVTPSSGNVFLDMGFAPAEAAVLALRADLMARLRLLVEREAWTQVEAARHFGVSQPRISALLRGKWDQFSLDMLITLATRVGQRVELSLTA
jgi:predicted XRE-type DNA-binding protein